MKCSICGTEMKVIKSFGAVDYFCENCGNGCTCIFNEEIELDERIYELKLGQNESNSNNIKIISNICNCNYLEAKKLIDNCDVIAKHIAIRIKPKKEILDNNYINYIITPNFKY